MDKKIELEILELKSASLQHGILFAIIQVSVIGVLLTILWMNSKDTVGLIMTTVGQSIFGLLGFLSIISKCRDLIKIRKQIDGIKSITD